MSILSDAINAAADGNYSFAAAKIAEAGFPDIASQVQQSGIMGAPPQDVARIATNLLKGKGGSGGNASVPTVLTDVAFSPAPVGFQAPVAKFDFGNLLGAIPVIGGTLETVYDVGDAVLGSGVFGGGGLPDTSQLPSPGYVTPYAGPTGAFAGLANTPIIPGGLLTPGIGPTIGTVTDVFANFFGSGGADPTQTLPAPTLQLAGSNLAKPAAHRQLMAPAPGFVIATVKATDPLFTAAVAAGGVPQANGSVKIAMR
jgi:hypothetical protein